MDFRAPLYIIVSFALYGALHSLLATRQIKAWVYDRFGGRGQRYYRLIYNLIGVLTLLPILALLAAIPGQQLYSWAVPWLFLALGLQGIGALIILVGLLQTGIWPFFGLGWLFGESQAFNDKLIKSGLYGQMRHPLYTGGLLLLWCMPVMTTGLLAFNLAASLYLYIGSVFEEQRLLAIFGEEYADYQRRVPRLIPNPWRRHKS
ncbi:MAG: isoprenylcysteine carboxylmethyltransferase family protein [Anaerolineales bacterium]|jgi:protein-S-isoprenylcysteine O-methyltransferase Ste14